jgi:hypothetical protein
MNLPDSAITFLDAFRGILVPSSSQTNIDLTAIYDVMPMVHCHCFTRELEREAAERDIRHVRASLRFLSKLCVLTPGLTHAAAR